MTSDVTSDDYQSNQPPFVMVTELRQPGDVMRGVTGFAASCWPVASVAASQGGNQPSGKACCGAVITESRSQVVLHPSATGRCRSPGGRGPSVQKAVQKPSCDISAAENERTNSGKYIYIDMDIDIGVFFYTNVVLRHMQPTDVLNKIMFKWSSGARPGRSVMRKRRRDLFSQERQPPK